MRYIESPFNDAYSNMALEEYVFNLLPRQEDWFMLWQNKNAIVVGKFQNTAAELNAGFVKDSGIQVVRRLTGGGAMYQDLGNLNFTFVTNRAAGQSIDFSFFVQPVVDALRRMGADARAGDRNDILIGDRKVSGNSQYSSGGRTLHHGTLLFNSDLSVLGRALNPKPDKLEAKGVKSVRSRVANILDTLPDKITLDAFKQALTENLFRQSPLAPYTLSAQGLAAVQTLRDEKYATWEWNYGRSPAFRLHRERRYPFGGLALYLSAQGGLIQDIAFEGDFFGNGDINRLTTALRGARLQENALAGALAEIDVADYIHGFTTAGLIALLLE